MMFDNVFKVIYLAGLIVYLFGLYGPNMRRHNQMQITKVGSTKFDLLLVALSDIGQLIALVYIFTPWLDSANYRLPAWIGLVGVVILAAALWLVGNAHATLGRNFSPRIELGEQQTLITQGVYHYIRHPIYAGGCLWGIAQPLLLQNWIAGFTMLATLLPLYLIRVPREEQMLLEHFGEEYRTYIAQTGRVIPRLRR